MISVFDSKEKIVKEGENAVYQYFFPFQKSLQKTISQGCYNSGL